MTRRSLGHGFFRRGVEGRKSRPCSCARACVGNARKQGQIRAARIMALKKKRYSNRPTSRNVAANSDSNVQTKPYTQTPVCFNLAFPIKVADGASLHANPESVMHQGQERSTQSLNQNCAVEPQQIVQRERRFRTMKVQRDCAQMVV